MLLKSDAEAYLVSHIKQVIISVPNHFSFSQRQAIKEAGRIAGLDVIRAINDRVQPHWLSGRKKRRRLDCIDLRPGRWDF